MPLPSRVRKYWEFFEASGKRHALDPYLLAAICDRESLCGLAWKPEGPDGTGDNGHGRGLMQIDDRSHAAWLEQALPDGTPKWQDPASNIEFGASLLAELMHVFSDAEPCAVGAYNAGPRAVRLALEEITKGGPGGPPADAVVWALDQVTTGHSYVSAVLQRRAQFKALELATDPPPPVRP